MAASGRYGVVEEYTGHGIGSAMHMDPPVPNYGRPGRGPRLRPGMALAIEPMVMLGSPETVLLDDGWTVVTADGSWAAHFEHTVAITPDGPWVLTAEDGDRDRCSASPVQTSDTRREDPAISADRGRTVGGGWSSKEGCPVPGDPRIRASDADRDRVTALLREHHAAGRLTAEEFHERMEQALDAKTLGELDELLADLPAIDLYQLPDASLRRAPPHLGQSLLPADRRAGQPAQVRAGDRGHGGLGRGHVGSHRHLGRRRRDRRRDLVPVVGADRDPVDLGGHDPPLAASPGIAAGRVTCLISWAVRVGARGRVHSSPAHLLGSTWPALGGSRKRARYRPFPVFSSR